MSQKFQDIVEKSYDSVAEDWSKTRKNLHWEDFDWMYEAAPCSSERDKILDLGCGTGRLFDFLESKGCVYQQYTGVDLSKNMLQQAQKHYPKNRYVQGSMLSIPVTDTGSIDQVWCIAAFHHLGSRQERLEALMEISRVLKPGWKLMITVWNLYQDTKKFNKARKASFWRSLLQPWKYSKKDLLFNWRHTDILRYYYAFDDQELSILFQKTGFEVSQFQEGKNLSYVLRKL